MDNIRLQVLSNIKIARDIYKMELIGELSEKILPGQFINMGLDGLFLRRPISVCDFNNNKVTVIYKVVGLGTDKMSKMVKGNDPEVLSPLGNGFNLEKSGAYPLLIGGGLGAAPLYYLGRTLCEQGKNVSVVLGFNTEKDVILNEEFERLGCNVVVATVDGSLGEKGFAPEYLPKEYSYFYSCGPMPMMKALNKAVTGSGEMSLEERMGCGFGACMGCSIRTKRGFMRVCKEGPVFEREDLIWED